MVRSLGALALFCAAPLYAQTLRAQTPPPLRVRVLAPEHAGESPEPLPGASVQLVGTSAGAVTNADGEAGLTGLAPGRYTVRVSFVGYVASEVTTDVPRADVLVVTLVPDAEALEELIVTTTRTGRTLADTPSRVEAIDAEEIEEKIAMDPSGLSMLLAESPGVVVQPTSAVSAASSFRIQGLDGRYTQLLRDGLPLYGGLSGSLALLQVPPLDLARVELLKGPGGALYGGDAISGLVNLISRTPPRADGAERSLLLNATTAGGGDASYFEAVRSGRWGRTVLATANVQRAYDAEDDGFTNLPAIRRLGLSPTLFADDALGGALRVGASGTWETREGGATAAVGHGGPGYAERTDTWRTTGFATWERALSPRTGVGLRASGSAFHRDTRVTGTASPLDTRFSGDQVAAFGEATLRTRRGAHALVFGLDARLDRFAEHAPPAGADRSYALGSLGVFAHNTWDVAPALALEGDVRVDATSEGVVALPRAAALVRLGRGVSVRGAAGLGYKVPTPFLEAAEAVAFRGVPALDDGLVAERSAGGTLDLTYQGVAFGALPVSATAGVFRTDLRHALVLDTLGGRALALRNRDGLVRAQGVETSARFDLDPLKLFLGYVYLDASEPGPSGRVATPVSAAHRTYTVLVWEAHGRFRVGAEAYYTSPQRLSDGRRVPGYWLTGVLAERRFGRVRVFANFENLLDARQSRTAPLVTGTATAPRFAELWGPTDGRIINAGIRLDL